MKRTVYKKTNSNKERPKAFLGAIIGAAAGIAGSIISGSKKKKSEELAFQQQQDEQTRMEGIQQANALTSSYGNQGYVDQYQDKVVLKDGGKVKYKKGKANDRIAMTTKYAIGGRKKYEDGGEDPESNAGISKSITAIGNGISGAIDTYNVNSTPTIPSSVGTGLQSIIANKKIADNANAKMLKPAKGTIVIPSPINTTLDVKPVNANLLKLGGKRKQAGFGSFLSGVGEAITGVSGLVGAIASKPKAPKMIKKADGFSYAAPKTGLVQNSYQVDENGNPVTMINTNNTIIDPTTGAPPVYTDRIAQAKMGKRIIAKRVAKSNSKY